MADLISRAAAIERAIYAIDDWDGGWNPNRETAIRKYFAEVPAVDAVPVVRCRDCKYFVEHNDGQGGNCNHLDYDGEYEFYVAGDWFCADGERRDSDGTN